MAYCGLARSSIARVGGRRWQGTKRVVGQLTVRPMVTGTATAGRGGPKAACVRRIARGCSDAYEGAAVVVASGRRVAIANTWAPSESLQRRHSSAAGVDGARVTALYAGSFDPPTVGHIDIIRRSLAFCDRLIVAVALNPGKKYAFPTEDRVRFVKQSVEHLGDDVEVHEFSGLVTDLAKRADIGASFMVRGIRSASEFEYEHRLSYLNREVADMETVFLVADEKLLFTSSSAVRETAHFKRIIKGMLPPAIEREVCEHYGIEVPS